MTYQHSGKCGSGLSITQTENQVTLTFLHFERFLSNPCSQPFAYCSYNSHNHSHLQSLAFSEKATYINYHSHSNQEIRNKKCVTHKFQTVHQRRNVRNVSVYHKSSHKRAKDTFHADKFHKSCTKEYHRKDKNKLHYAVIIFTEKPSAKFRHTYYN